MIQNLSLHRVFSAKRIFVLIMVLCTLIAAFTSTTQRVQAQSRHALNFSDSLVLWTTSAANISGDSTIIDNTVTNGNANAILIVSQNWSQTGNCGCVYNNHPIGVWYNVWIQRWEIFNEDSSIMPVGAIFDVAIWSAALAQTGVTIYTHIAGINTGLPYTDITNGISDNNPNAMVLVTPIWNPPLSGRTVFDNHAIGVWYNASTGHWSIFNEDESAMPSYAGFNVLVFNSTYAWAFEGSVLTSTAANTFFDYTNLTGPLAKNIGFLWVTHNWNPGGCVAGSGCQVFHNHNLGVWYDGQLSVFNEDVAAMPLGVSFNVLEITK